MEKGGCALEGGCSTLELKWERRCFCRKDEGSVEELLCAVGSEAERVSYVTQMEGTRGPKRHDLCSGPCVNGAQGTVGLDGVEHTGLVSQPNSPILHSFYVPKQGSLSSGGWHGD